MNTFKTQVKVSLIVISLLFSILFTGLVFSQSNEENQADRIYAVDHPHNQLWVNDKLYVMPITLDVYTFNLKSRKKTKANRYALRKGQSVSFKKIIRNRQAIITEITIYQ